jgi:hypothetical protein
MIAADFLGDPTGYRIGHALPNAPCEWQTDSRKLWAFLFDWAWNALGWSGMTLAIDGHTGIPLRHLSHVDPRLGYSTAAGKNAPRQDVPLDWVRASSVCIAYRHMPECRSIGGALF